MEHIDLSLTYSAKVILTTLLFSSVRLCILSSPLLSEADLTLFGFLLLPSIKVSREPDFPKVSSLYLGIEVGQLVGVSCWMWL